MAKTIINLLVGSVGSKFTEWQNALALTFELETDVKDVSSALTEAETVKTSAADAIDKAETAESSVKTNFIDKLSAIETIIDKTNDTPNSIKTYIDHIKSFLNDSDKTLEDYKSKRDAYFDFVAGISTTGNEDTLKLDYDKAKSDYDIEIEKFESDYNNLLVYFDEYNASIEGIYYSDIVTALRAVYSLYSRADSNVDNAISVKRAAGVNVNNAITLKNDFENQLTSAKEKSFELEKEFENICPTYFEHVNNVNQSKIYSIKAETARIKKEIETINAETQDILYDLSKNQSTTQEEIIVAFKKLNTAVDSEVTLATNLQKDITNEAISVSFTETIKNDFENDIASEITDITALQTSVNTLRDTITDKGFNESLNLISGYNNALSGIVNNVNSIQTRFYDALNNIDDSDN